MFSKTDKNIVEFIYGNESIVKIFIFIYFLPTYEIFSKLIKKKIFYHLNQIIMMNGTTL